MQFRRISSASVNQSGRCFVLAVATSKAAVVMCSSKFSINSDGVEKIENSLSSSKYSSIFFWKAPNCLLRRILLSIFLIGAFSLSLSLGCFFSSRGPLGSLNSMNKAA